MLRTFQDTRNLLREPLDEASDIDGEATRFRRWEYRMVPRLLPGGYFPKPSILLDELERYQRSHERSNALPAMQGGNWRVLGPSLFDALDNNNGATGRVSVIRFAPNDTNTIFVGTPDGGAWRTTDGGTNWKPLTDRIPNLGVSDIAIDPSNPSNIYLATGDAKDAGMYGNPYSYGILKSSDGGASWAMSGLSWDVSERVTIPRLVISAADPKILLAGVYGGTHRGIQRSTDGGATWSQRDGGSIYDIQYNPADPSIVYASGYGNFRRSTDGGSSWTTVTSILPTYTGNNVSRTAIGVTPADPNIVYVLYVSHTNNQIYGLYKSTDKGLTFTQVFQNTPTVFGNYGEYNLVFSVSPKDPNLLILGEQYLAKSTDGGLTWKPIHILIHVDNHALQFTPSGARMFSGNDGGIYRSSDGGKNWTDLNTGLVITQFYRVGNYDAPPSLLYAGAQDNGISHEQSTIWSHALTGADGAECVVDPSNPDTVFMEFQQGYLYRSDDGGQTANYIAPATNGHWITPIVMHPNDPDQIYAAYQSIWHTSDRGETWAKTSAPIVSGDNIKSLAIAPSDPRIMYAGTYVRLFKSTDAGTTWNELTSNTPTSDSIVLTSITVSRTDANKIWLTYSGFIDGQHMYSSTDGGATWKNITGSLPNVPVNTSVYDNNSQDGIYIGTDLGVYYRDATMNDWESFNTELPNVSISELEIDYAKGRLLAATFGRGIWWSLLRNEVPPLAPSLRLPPNDTVGTVLHPFFSWDGYNGLQYGIDVATDSQFSTIVFHRDSFANHSFVLPLSLATGTTYYWRTHSMNAFGPGAWSDTWRFTTIATDDVQMHDGDEQMSVIPNPASRTIRFERPAGWDTPAEVVISSVLGVPVLRTTIRAERAGERSDGVDVSGLCNGTYLYMLRVGESLYRGCLQIVR
ncbi:MAG: hypothetical protein JSS75_09310 [Bacteroidetes bacterium]|nr:hypothetical protein [Bacteroidota bacterium]